MGKDRTTFTAITLMVLVGLGVSACGNDDDSSSTAEFAPTMDAESPSGESVDAGRTGTDEQSGTVESGGENLAEQTPGSPFPTDRALATTAGVTVATSDIRAAVADTLTAAQRNGASVFTADVSIGDERDDGSVDGSGYFVVKVPPAELEPLITDLGATVGRLSGRTQDTTDVTDQLVDLDIRIGVERDVIARFQTLLVAATEFQDIVEIERVISERTISLEQLLAGQRNLDNRVELSTLTIQLQYEVPTAEIVAVEDNSIDGIGDAWRAGWDVFLGALFAIGFVLAVAAPFMATAALVLGVVWLVSRRRRHTSRSDRSPSGAPSSVTGPAVGPSVEPAVGPVTESVDQDEQLAGPSPRG